MVPYILYGCLNVVLKNAGENAHGETNKRLYAMGYDVLCERF